MGWLFQRIDDGAGGFGKFGKGRVSGIGVSPDAAQHHNKLVDHVARFIDDAHATLKLFPVGTDVTAFSRL